jgi:RND family efflux transporter MFP subunit
MDTSELVNQLKIDRDARRPRSRRPVLVLAGILLLAVSGGAWYVVAQPGRPVVRVAMARAAAQTGAPSVLDASGYVTARRQATVSAKVTGKVTEVLIEEGMRVEEGAVLARLDDTEARAQLVLAGAQLTAARSALGEIRAMLEQATRDHTRQEQLHQRELVSAQSLDAALAQRDMLRARLVNAEQQVAVANEAVAVAQVQLDNTVIRAPFSGVVVAKSAQPGEMISPISAGGGFTRTGIGTIVDMDSLEIQVDVNEAYINRVTANQPVEATLNAYPDWKIPGSVIAIIPTADRAKATVKVRIAINSKDRRLVPDMGVRVGFLSGRPSRAATPATATLVPVEAVRADGTNGVVFVYAGDRVERRTVRLGPEVSGQRQVLSGLRVGERVVLSPSPSLGDGDAVRLAES